MLFEFLNRCSGGPLKAGPIPCPPSEKETKRTKNANDDVIDKIDNGPTAQNQKSQTVEDEKKDTTEKNVKPTTELSNQEIFGSLVSLNDYVPKQTELCERLN